MDILRLLPQDVYDAAVNANSPTAANPFATIADLGGAGGETLAQTLAIGNITGANDIVVTTGQAITSDNVTPANQYKLVLSQGGSGGKDYFALIQGDTSFTAPPFSYNGSAIYGDSAALAMWWSTGGNIEAQLSLSASGMSTLVSNGDDISWGTFLGTANFSIGASVNFRIQDSLTGSYGNFDTQPLPADVTYTFQDSSGIVAFLADIPAGAGNNIYNTDGALTANRTVTGAFDLNINNGGAFRRTGNFVFAEGATREIRVEQSTGLAGYDLTVAAGAAANGLGTGGDLYLEPGAGGTTPGGAAGDIWIRGLAGNGNAIGSTVNIASGSSPNNRGGDILVTTGNGGGAGVGGDFSITTGTGTARGSIIFVDGSEGTIGDVWTSSGVGGQGTWSTPANVATGQTWTDPTNLPGIPVRGGYDANATTIDELADVLGQLIVDLRTTDILN